MRKRKLSPFCAFLSLFSLGARRTYRQATAVLKLRGEGEKQKPRRYHVKTVTNFCRLYKATLITRETLHNRRDVVEEKRIRDTASDPNRYRKITIGRKKTHQHRISAGIIANHRARARVYQRLAALMHIPSASARMERKD